VGNKKTRSKTFYRYKRKFGTPRQQVWLLMKSAVKVCRSIVWMANGMDGWVSGWSVIRLVWGLSHFAGVTISLGDKVADCVI